LGIDAPSSQRTLYHGWTEVSRDDGGQLAEAGIKAKWRYQNGASSRKLITTRRIKN
jgi:hypothetical protein